MLTVQYISVGFDRPVGNSRPVGCKLSCCRLIVFFGHFQDATLGLIGKTRRPMGNLV
jgi:hypothetical protein